MECPNATTEMIMPRACMCSHCETHERDSQTRTVVSISEAPPRASSPHKPHPPLRRHPFVIWRRSKMFQSNPRVAAFLFPLVVVFGLLVGPRASADPLDGWWVSDGYGLVLEITGERIKASQITAISCLPDWTA